MKKSAWSIVVIVVGCLFLSCKKDSAHSSATKKRVRSVASHLYSIDSAHRPHTLIDSFVYDNLNRVKTLVLNGFDTLRVIDNGNITTEYRYHNVSQFDYSYTGNNIYPSAYRITYLRNNMLLATETHLLAFNNQNQIVSDSVIMSGPGSNTYQYSYGEGLIVRFKGDWDALYSLDSIWEKEGNVIKRAVGANYYASPSNQNQYQRLASRNYSFFSNINPLYTPNVFVVLLLSKGIPVNKNIESVVEVTLYDPLLNTAISRTNFYQADYDSNGLLLRINNLTTGERTEYNYY